MRRPHARLGHVVPDLERVLLLRCSPAHREKAPADQQEVGDPRRAERETGRREVEQKEPLARRLGPKGRDQKVRRRPDQGDHAAEQGGERQRHQQQGRRVADAAVPSTGRRGISRASAPTLFMNAGQQRAQQAERGQVGERRAGRVDQPAGERIDRAGARQRAADHQHRGDGDHRGIAEPGKRRLRRHQPEQDSDHQAGDRDHVVAPAVPDEHRQRARPAPPVSRPAPTSSRPRRRRSVAEGRSALPATSSSRARAVAECHAKREPDRGTGRTWIEPALAAPTPDGRRVAACWMRRWYIMSVSIALRV